MRVALFILENLKKISFKGSSGIVACTVRMTDVNSVVMYEVQHRAFFLNHPTSMVNIIARVTFIHEFLLKLNW